MTFKSYRKALMGAAAAGLALGLAACSTAAKVDTPEFGEAWPNLAVEDTQGFDPAAIAALESRMEKFVTDGDVKGVATLLVQDGRVVSHMQAGVNNEAGDPITEDTIYRIYSMSKPITGVAMMMLWEDGKWDLDDPVTKYVPEFENLRVLVSTGKGSTAAVPVDRPPTMREVMSHTAGFAYGLGGEDHANDQFRQQAVLRSPDMKTFIDKVADIPLLYQPGEQWFYSAAVDVQGYIVEKLSGMSFGEYLDAELFTPLGMDDTGFYVPEDQLSRLGDVYSWYDPAKRLVAVPGENYTYRKEDIPFESGGGGLASTLQDYARFCQMLLDGGSLGDVQILKPETVELMRTDVLPDGAVMFSDGTNSSTAKENGMGFGLDFGIIMDPSKGEIGYGPGTYYWGGAAGTWFWIDPANDLYFIGMVQRFGTPPTLRAESAKKVYAAIAADAGTGMGE